MQTSLVQSCKSTVSIIAAASLLVVSTVTMAEKQNNSIKSKYDDEVISVVGQYPLSYYSKNLRKAEDQFFNEMNALVSDDDFKVSCETQRLQAFSRLKGRACEAAFVSRIIGDETQRNFDLMSLSSKLGNFDTVLPTRVKREIENRKLDYLEELAALINANPDLLKSYNELELAKIKYEIAKDIK
jgi:hypothetical protein